MMTVATRASTSSMPRRAWLPPDQALLSSSKLMCHGTLAADVEMNSRETVSIR